MEQYMGKECKISQNPRYETIADKQDKPYIQLSCPGLEPLELEQFFNNYKNLSFSLNN